MKNSDLAIHSELVRLREENRELKQLLYSDHELIQEENIRASSSKTAFLANLSHEIRTPMMAILGYTEMLKEEHLSSVMRQDALNHLEKSSLSLLKVIQDVLDISQFESGKISIEKTRFSPRETILEEVEKIRRQAEEKGLHFYLCFDQTLPEMIFTDSFRLRQILNHMLGNAIKFTHQGEISLKVKTETDRTNRQVLHLEFKDSGIGINKRNRIRIFKPFTQVDESLARQFGGTGLGLILTKRLSEELGGELTLQESTVGAGTHDLESARILIVDDVIDNQYLLRHYLEAAGAIVDVASDGYEAIRKALAHKYDIVLMDMQMPHLDGIQAVKRLRGSGYSRPIVALTAHSMLEEIQRSIDAGCDEHLTKPISKWGLLDTVCKYVRI